MKITIQSARGCKSFAFPEEMTAGEAVVQAVEAFDFPLGHCYGLLLSENATMPLESGRTLASYTIHDGAIMFLATIDC